MYNKQVAKNENCWISTYGKQEENQMQTLGIGKEGSTYEAKSNRRKNRGVTSNRKF